MSDAPAEAPERAKPKQSTRLLKVTCRACGYTVRTTAKWLALGSPACPCGATMERAA